MVTEQQCQSCLAPPPEREKKWKWLLPSLGASQVLPEVKNLPANAGDVGSIPGSEDPLEEGMVIHSSIVA